MGCFAAQWRFGVVCQEWFCRRSLTKVWVWRPEALANGEPYLYLRVSRANVRACRERFRRIRDRNARADTPLPREPEWSGAPIGYRMNYRSDGLPSLVCSGQRHNRCLRRKMLKAWEPGRFRSGSGGNVTGFFCSKGTKKNRPVLTDGAIVFSTMYHY